MKEFDQETFWNEIEQRWPWELKKFITWFEEYKERVQLEGWSCRYDLYDLPAAMQIGIFLQYCMEEPHRYEFFEGMPADLEQFGKAMKEWFCEEHDHQQQVDRSADDFDINLN